MSRAEEFINFLDISNNSCCCISINTQTGSTWAQEMVWLLGNNLDYEAAKQLQVTRSPLLELTAIFAEDHTDWLKLRCFMIKS